MDHKEKAIAGSLAGILSYMVLLVVSIRDVMRNYEAMVHISPLHVSFLITLALVIFRYLPIKHSPKSLQKVSFAPSPQSNTRQIIALLLLKNPRTERGLGIFCHIPHSTALVGTGNFLQFGDKR